VFTFMFIIFYMSSRYIENRDLKEHINVFYDFYFVKIMKN